jgi:DNA-binding IclR family transcriptional regulator
VLGETDGGMGITELGERTELNGSTVHRLLSTLLEQGYVQQDPESKKYMLGTQSLRLGYAALSHFDIREEALTQLRALSEKVQESANLALLTGDEATYVAQVPAPRPVHMFTQLGSRVPLYCTGVGKAVLAYLDETAVLELLDGDMSAYTENTITSTEELLQVFALVRERGYAVDDEGLYVGVRCVSAPVFRADGTVFGAVSISGPSARLSPARDQEFSQHVLATARGISRRLGFRDVHAPTFS